MSRHIIDIKMLAACALLIPCEAKLATVASITGQKPLQKMT
jgi:hypothetical protein